MALKFSGGIFRIQLNGSQHEMLKFATQGQNLITGEDGVGKNWVVKQIIATLNACRRPVGLLCSSVISCQVCDQHYHC